MSTRRTASSQKKSAMARKKLLGVAAPVVEGVRLLFCNAIPVGRGG